MKKTDLPETKPNRARPAPYRLLDAWRGVASLSVVVYHWGGIAVHYAPSIASNGLYRVSEYGFLGVQLFFVISGFCIAASAMGLLVKFEKAQVSVAAKSAVSNFMPPSVSSLMGAYLTARARRVYPTYWAGIAFALLFSWAATQLARAGRISDNIYTHFDAAHLPPSTLFANATLLAVPLRQDLLLAVVWTLCYEVAFYTIIGAALWMVAWLIARRKVVSVNTDTLLNILHSVTIGSLLWLCFDPIRVPFPLELWPQFGLGVLLYDLLMVVNPARKRVAPFALVGTLLLLGWFVIFRNTSVGAMGQPAHLTFPVSGAFTLLLLAMYRHDSFLLNKMWVRGLSFVGLFSYSLYLTHTITLRVAGQLFQKAHLFPRFHYLVFVLAMAFSVAAAYVFFLLFEKPILSHRKIEREPVP